MVTGTNEKIIESHFPLHVICIYAPHDQIKHFSFIKKNQHIVISTLSHVSINLSGLFQTQVKVVVTKQNVYKLQFTTNWHIHIHEHFLPLFLK